MIFVYLNSLSKGSRAPRLQVLIMLLVLRRGLGQPEPFLRKRNPILWQRLREARHGSGCQFRGLKCALATFNCTWGCESMHDHSLSEKACDTGRRSTRGMPQ